MSTAWPWIVLAVVVIALIILAVVALGTARRLRPLQAAVADAKVQLDPAPINARVAEMDRALTQLQQRTLVTQERIAQAKEQVAAIRSSEAS